jgi:hypothetical protein
LRNHNTNQARIKEDQKVYVKVLNSLEKKDLDEKHNQYAIDDSMQKLKHRRLND